MRGAVGVRWSPGIKAVGEGRFSRYGLNAGGRESDLAKARLGGSGDGPLL